MTPEPAEPKVGPLENRLVFGLLLLLGVCGLLLAARLVWEFRDVFIPLGLLIGAAWFFQRNVLRRRP